MLIGAPLDWELHVMPFTLAHPIAAAPLWYLCGQRLVLSALVVGCMSPDLEYFFFWFGPRRTISHQPLGLFLMDLPLGLLLLWAWDGLIRPRLLPLFPSRAAHLAAALDRPLEMFRPGRLLLVSLSILIGAVSHIVWDAATHGGGWIVERWSVLQYVIALPGGVRMPVFAALQRGGSVIGLALIALWIGLWVQSVPRDRRIDVLPARFRYRAAAIIGAAVLAGGICNAWTSLRAFGIAPLSADFSIEAVRAAIVYGVVGGISAGTLGMILAALLTPDRRTFSIEPA